MDEEPKRDIQGLGLSLLNRFAGSKTVDKLGLRKPAEQALYQASRASFTAASLAGKQFKNVKKLLRPERLSTGEQQDLFDLRPTEEQAMMREAARRFAEEVLRPAAADAEQHLELSREVWSAGTELGLATMAVPESLGGAGAERSVLSNALVAEALAWGDMGQAVALLAPVGVANALATWGNADQQGRYLTAFALNEPPDAAIALLEPGPVCDPLAPGCRGERDGDDWLITGEKTLVPLGPFASLYIVSADLEGLGPRLLLIPGDAENLHREGETAMGLRASALGRLQMRGVRVTSEAVLGDADALTDLVHLGRLAWCALAVGNATAVLDLVGPYTNERKAFGEPVSHRQGVAFIVANLAIETDAMRLMLWRALSRHEQGLSWHREAVLAHRFCVEHAMQLGSDGVQLLGGHGFVKEFPVERWYRDLRAIALMDGGLML